ncbi:MAG: AraC family ligand binding domain-containing protein, partial [Clostridia bacterium]|nr:AraC family ligand binding domain-containing protein [Clostridia bacterium]
MNRLTKEYHIGSTHEISCTKRHMFKYIPLHFHEFYEIEYVLNGEGKCVLNGENYERNTGTLFFMTPLDCHELDAVGSDFVNIMFSEQLISSDLLEPFLRYSAPKAIPITEEERPFFESLFNEMIKNSENTVYCTTLLQCLLLKLTQLLPINETAHLSSAVSQMHFFIRTNFQKKITLEDAAAYANLTPTYASALFKKEMQINFKAFVDALRFDLARKLLITSTQPVNKIC